LGWVGLGEWFAWLIGLVWLVGWLVVGWLGWSVGWSVGWLIGWVVRWLGGWVFGWLFGIEINGRHQRAFIPLTIKIHLHYTERLISNLTDNTVHFH
jgi:hypothetical protein